MVMPLGGEKGLCRSNNDIRIRATGRTPSVAMDVLAEDWDYTLFCNIEVTCHSGLPEEMLGEMV